jgi:hypothetical protein
MPAPHFPTPFPSTPGPEQDRALLARTVLRAAHAAQASALLAAADGDPEAALLHREAAEWRLSFAERLIARADALLTGCAADLFPAG